MDEKRCAHCNRELGSRYWGDIPGVGDLCPSCHDRWMEERDGDGREGNKEHR